jgi:hypothetical protein
LTAAKLLGEIAGVTRFATDAKLVRTAGSAPVPASSCRSQRHRLDRGGNRQLNCALHRLAVTKGRLDPDTAAYLAQALREKIGDGPFFQILRTWTAQHRYGTATTEQFVALSQQISGQDLTDFFRIWLYTPQKPATW